MYLVDFEGIRYSWGYDLQVDLHHLVICLQIAMHNLPQFVAPSILAQLKQYIKENLENLLAGQWRMLMN